MTIGLTGDGRAIFDALYPVVQQLNASLMAVFTAQEQAQFDALLSRLEQRAGTWMADAELPKADRRRHGGAGARGAP